MCPAQLDLILRTVCLSSRFNKAYDKCKFFELNPFSTNDDVLKSDMIFPKC